MSSCLTLMRATSPCTRAQPARSALRPQLAFKAVAAKVKLHDQAREKLRQLDFVANAYAGKVDFL